MLTYRYANKETGDAEDNGLDEFYTLETEDKVIGRVEKEADAAFIVEACNNYLRLKEELSKMTESRESLASIIMGEFPSDAPEYKEASTK